MKMYGAKYIPTSMNNQIGNIYSEIGVAADCELS